MKLEQAKTTASLERDKHNQDMYVVEKNREYYAASRLDLQRQFSGLTPVLSYPARRKPTHLDSLLIAQGYRGR